MQNRIYCALLSLCLFPHIMYLCNQIRTIYFFYFIVQKRQMLFHLTQIVLLHIILVLPQPRLYSLVNPVIRDAAHGWLHRRLTALDGLLLKYSWLLLRLCVYVHILV